MTAGGRLAGKSVLITGAASGIGRSAAHLFAAEGASVLIADVDREAGTDVERSILKQGGTAAFQLTDITTADSVQRCVAAAVRTFGSLHVLYNNAGGSTSSDGPVTTTEEAHFRETVELELLGTWLCCKYGIPEIIRSGGGAVVNTTSVAALLGLGGRDSYVAAKGGVISLTRSMAAEYGGSGVRVNALAPGRTHTERIAKLLAAGSTQKDFADRHLLGVADPIDVAYAALFLASDEARKVTGQVLAVDGGVSVG